MSDVQQFNLDALWDRLDQEANERKFSHEALIRLRADYENWDPEMQAYARKRFGKWLASDNARKRFDALSMIDELSIGESFDDLKEHRDRLKKISGPEARFELERVEKILTQLGVAPSD